MTKSEKEELAYITELFNTRAADLMTCALALSELLEHPNETPRADGGRPLKHINCVWEDAVERIAEVQKSAKYCADDLIHIRWSILNYIDSPTTPDLEKPKPKTLADRIAESEKAV